jgi:hypothetical protein
MIKLVLFSRVSRVDAVADVNRPAIQSVQEFSNILRLQGRHGVHTAIERVSQSKTRPIMHVQRYLLNSECIVHPSLVKAGYS